jgi:hypothetical protein
MAKKLQQQPGFPQLYRDIDVMRVDHDRYHDNLNRALNDRYQDYRDAISTLQNLCDFLSGSALVINGGCEVNQRATATLSTALQYGSVDRFKVAVTAGTVSAGTITQTTSSTAGRTGYALHVSGASLATTPTLSVDTYIEAKNAVLLKNTTSSVALQVYHDVGSTITYTISIDKATASDNFAAVTNIATSVAQSVPTGIATTISLLGVSMADCSNGIRIRVSCSPGTTTTKNFHYTEFRIVDSPSLPLFRYERFNDELQRCRRYFWKTFPYGTAPAQNVGSGAGSATYPATLAGVASWRVNWPLGVVMRITGTATTYNPAAANANWRNLTAGADSGVPTAAVAGDTALTVVNPQVAGDLLGNIIQIHVSVEADF